MSIELAWIQAITGGAGVGTTVGHSTQNGVHISAECPLCNDLRHLLKEVAVAASDTSQSSLSIIRRVRELGIEEPDGPFNWCSEHGKYDEHGR